MIQFDEHIFQMGWNSTSWYNAASCNGVSQEFKILRVLAFSPLAFEPISFVYIFPECVAKGSRL